ncbi:MAG: hypothetical protein GF347_05650 [Candidatus Moranbacteria bacterium]|nr:hypothetical protein [Candidatus Moranbacteria bacterium]
MQLFFLIEPKIKYLFFVSFGFLLLTNYWLYSDDLKSFMLYNLVFLIVIPLEFWISYSLFFDKDREKSIITVSAGNVSKIILLLLPGSIAFFTIKIPTEIIIEYVIIKSLLRKRIRHIETLFFITILTIPILIVTKILQAIF